MMIKKNYVSFDVLISGGARFYKTLRMPVTPLVPITEKLLHNYARKILPSLENKKFSIKINI